MTRPAALAWLRVPARRRPSALSGLSIAVLTLAAASPAAADVFGPLSLVSVGAVGGGGPQQVEYAHDPALSGDGRFVVFDGSVGGVTGVWRRDLGSGAIEQVAGGAAQLPSVSEDGRYVSFTTNEGASLAADTNDHPVAVADPEAVNVYVRDMAVGAGEEGAFAVASAPSHSGQPLTYRAPFTTFGSVAAGRSAISADGNEVAFVTTAVSDLSDPETPLEPTTPAYQVAVRYLASQETKLVTTDRSTGAPVSALEGSEPIGGVYPGRVAGFVQYPAYDERGQSPPPGAAISADGSTVAWMGDDIAAQAQMLPAESPSPLYTEPLWRRIAPGSETPTERITGGSDPASPACQASGETALPTAGQSPADPCLGPFVVSEQAANSSVGIWPNAAGTAGGIGDFVPRLSADGYEVAFISEALPKTAGENFNGARSLGEQADLYRVDMHPGLTRDQAITPLTELAGAERVADVEPINEFDISGDGEQVAFTTRRTAFPLGSPALVSAPAPEPGLNELFDADLRDATLTRVSHGYEGGASEQPHSRKPEEDQYGSLLEAGSESPSFSSDGTLLAFSSTASNLAFGDGNTPSSTPAGSFDGGDAFVVRRLVLGSVETQQYVSPPPQTDTQPAWHIGVTARSRADGSVLLYVNVPGGGSLRANAQGAIPVQAAAGSRAEHRARRRGPSLRPAHRAAAPRVRVVSRTVGTAARTVPAGGGEIVALVLKLGGRYSTLARRRGGLSASVSVAFAAAGHPTLSQAIAVTFVRKPPAARSKHRGHVGSSRKRGGR